MPYKQDPRGKGAEHEVFGRASSERGSERLSPGHDVEREGHEFGAEINREQVGTGDHDHHAGEGEEDEAIIFAEV